MDIPHSFRLMGHTIKVEVLPPIRWLKEWKDELGSFEPRDMYIRVLKRGSRSQTEQSFFHELVHAALYCMNNKLYDDEEFVDQLAGLLHQAMSSAKYK